MKKYLFILLLVGCKTANISISDIHIRARNETLIEKGVQKNHTNICLYTYRNYRILSDTYEFIRSVNDTVSTKIVNRYYIHQLGSKKLIIANDENGLNIWKTNIKATNSELSIFNKNMPLCHYHPINDNEFYRLIKPFSFDSSTIQVDKHRTKKIFNNFKGMDSMRVKISHIEIVVSNNFDEMRPFYNPITLNTYRKLHNDYLTEYNVLLDNPTNGLKTTIHIKIPTQSDSTLITKLIYLYHHSNPRNL